MTHHSDPFDTRTPAAKNQAGAAAVTGRLRRAGMYKGLLFVGAVILTASLFIATGMLVRQVRESAVANLQRTVDSYRLLLLNDNAELAYEAVQAIDFPIVVTDAHGVPKSWRNLTVDPEDTSAAAFDELYDFIEAVKRQGNEPIAVEVFPGQVDYFHYGDPALVKTLRFVSITTALAVALYIFLGYIGFRTIRKAEERSVWVGMARETAHQLGTPISSLMGWLEVLGSSGRPEVIEAMREDVRRLEKITVRFSKIGTVEQLNLGNLASVVKSSIDYMQIRVGSQVSITYEDRGSGDVAMQEELISWVLENVIRNAAQAMKGEGNIHIVSGRVDNGAYVDIIDEGVGIPKKEAEAIFRPGYTTKKRGWGLGLSLGRRIVQEIHRGKLCVLASKPGEGTTIRMVLP
ncbi:MAG TPA: HAMP domain-containing histidine kinase [Bacteroidetes bacterium]|nr:sporulation kinase E [bacterium BMS3Bbin04]HDO65395.1 HAMP domain-containing histidine kinase [Bacteroidota bacterium]HEX04520.1 HAMP domain-containing histidine kinase [Bacteroidota bacterium]